MTAWPLHLRRCFWQHYWSCLKKTVTDRFRQLEDSFSADFVYGVSGELTSNYYLLAHGLHYLTGNKETVQVTNRLGHGVSYKTVLDIETAQAQKAVTLTNLQACSLLKKNSIKQLFLEVFQNFQNLSKKIG